MQLKLLSLSDPEDARSGGERDFLERDQAKITLIKTRLNTKKGYFSARNHESNPKADNEKYFQNCGKSFLSLLAVNLGK